MFLDVDLNIFIGDFFTMDCVIFSGGNINSIITIPRKLSDIVMSRQVLRTMIKASLSISSIFDVPTSGLRSLLKYRNVSLCSSIAENVFSRVLASTFAV